MGDNTKKGKSVVRHGDKSTRPPSVEPELRRKPLKAPDFAFTRAVGSSDIHPFFVQPMRTWSAQFPASNTSDAISQAGPSSITASTSLSSSSDPPIHNSDTPQPAAVEVASDPQPEPELSPTQMVQRLLQHLPPPIDLDAHLTPSERIFSLKTHFNIRSLYIGGGEGTSHEFYLFMAMRQQYGWQTWRMSAAEFAQATEQYNERLTHENSRRGIRTTVPKHPRALVNKLAEVEAMCLNRIKMQDFKCTSYSACPLSYAVSDLLVSSKEFWQGSILEASLLCCPTGEASRRS